MIGSTRISYLARVERAGCLLEIMEIVRRGYDNQQDDSDNVHDDGRSWCGGVGGIVGVVGVAAKPLLRRALLV